MDIIVIYDVPKRGETTVVVKAAFRTCEQPIQRRRPVALVRRTVGLEVINANFGRRVHVPAWLGEERGHVAGRTPRLPIEYGYATGGGFGVKVCTWWLRCGN